MQSVKTTEVASGEIYTTTIYALRRNYGHSVYTTTIYNGKLYIYLLLIHVTAMETIGTSLLLVKDMHIDQCLNVDSL
jgi:hypothetical protein